MPDIGLEAIGQAGGEDEGHGGFRAEEPVAAEQDDDKDRHPVKRPLVFAQGPAQVPIPGVEAHHQHPRHPDQQPDQRRVALEQHQRRQRNQPAQGAGHPAEEVGVRARLVEGEVNQSAQGEDGVERPQNPAVHPGQGVEESVAGGDPVVDRVGHVVGVHAPTGAAEAAGGGAVEAVEGCAEHEEQETDFITAPTGKHHTGHSAEEVGAGEGVGDKALLDDVEVVEGGGGIDDDAGDEQPGHDLGDEETVAASEGVKEQGEQDGIVGAGAEAVAGVAAADEVEDEDEEIDEELEDEERSGDRRPGIPGGNEEERVIGDAVEDAAEGVGLVGDAGLGAGDEVGGDEGGEDRDQSDEESVAFAGRPQDEVDEGGEDEEFDRGEGVAAEGQTGDAGFEGDGPLGLEAAPAVGFGRMGRGHFFTSWE